MRAINLSLVLCVASFGAGSAWAADRPDRRQPQPPDARPGNGHEGQHRKPAEAAFAACNDLQPEDVCEVEQADRTIEGKCVPARDEARLLCSPDHPGER